MTTLLLSLLCLSLFIGVRPVIQALRGHRMSAATVNDDLAATSAMPETGVPAVRTEGTTFQSLAGFGHKFSYSFSPVVFADSDAPSEASPSATGSSSFTKEEDESKILSLDSYRKRAS